MLALPDTYGVLTNADSLGLALASSATTFLFYHPDHPKGRNLAAAWGSCQRAGIFDHLRSGNVAFLAGMADLFGW